MSDCKEKKD